MGNRRRLRSVPRVAAEPERSKVRIDGPLGLIDAAPYLVGFHPYASLVIAGLGGGLLVGTARLDLDGLESPPGAASIEHTLQVLARAGSDSVVALIFEDLAAALPVSFGPRSRLAAILARHAACHAIRVEDVLQIGDGRWRSLTCADPQCCPPDGLPLPHAVSEFAAAATLDGMAPLADRASVVARFAPLPDDRRDAVGRLVVGALADRVALDERVRVLSAAAHASDAPGWQPPDDAEAARLVAALGDGTEARDHVWLGIEDNELDGRPLWLHLGRCAPAPWNATPLFLYAWAAWRAGLGADASTAVELALASDPGLSAAELLDSALLAGVDPRTFPRVSLTRTA